MGLTLIVSRLVCLIRGHNWHAVRVVEHEHNWATSYVEVCVRPACHGRVGRILRVMNT